MTQKIECFHQRIGIGNEKERITRLLTCKIKKMKNSLDNYLMIPFLRTLPKDKNIEILLVGYKFLILLGLINLMSIQSLLFPDLETWIHLQKGTAGTIILRAWTKRWTFITGVYWLWSLKKKIRKPLCFETNSYSSHHIIAHWWIYL